MTDRPLDLHQIVRELTEPTTHQARYDYDHNGTSYTANWPTTNPPLITQLWSSAMSPSGQVEGPGGMAATSRPAANLDAIDAAADIDIQAARWVRDLGEDDPGDTIDCIRKLHALAASVHRCGAYASRRGRDCCTWHAIESDARSWWVRARVLTGWDTPARKLAGTCPLCGERDSVRVRFTAKLATCTKCHETWDEENIGMLAEHVRLEAEAERFAPPPAPDPCRCVWPQNEQFGRVMVCPDCGSRYCVKVQDQVVSRLPRHAG